MQPTRISRIEIEGLKSIRHLDLELRPLQVLVDASGEGVGDFVAALTLLHAVMEGRLQHHVAGTGSLEGEARPRLGLTLSPGGISYRMGLTRSSRGTWTLTHEEVGLDAGLEAALLDPTLPEASRFESHIAALSTQPDWESFPNPNPSDPEGRWLGFVLSQAMWELRQFLRGLRLHSASEVLGTPTLLLIDAPEPDLPPNAAWNLARFAREASERAQVIVCTRSLALADEFAPEELIVVDTHEGASRFRRHPLGQDGRS